MERKQKEMDELNGKIARLEAQIARLEAQIARDTELREKTADLDYQKILSVGINEKEKRFNIYLTKLRELEQEKKLLEGYSQSRNTTVDSFGDFKTRGDNDSSKCFHEDTQLIEPLNSMKISGDDEVPSSQRQESKSLSHSTSIATYDITISASFSSLRDLLVNICQVKEVTLNTEISNMIYNEFENNRRQLLEAMNKIPSKDAATPTTLGEAVEIGLLSSTHESVLQSICFDDIKIIGDYCLENTSGAVLCDGEDGDDGGFRKLNFASASDHSNRPDITIRRKFESDISMKTYDANTQLEKFRLLPWFVVSYVELKRWNVKLDDHVYKTLYYCQQTLSCCPDRNYFIAALYNFNSLVFCIAVYINGEMEFYTTDEKREEVASRELAYFLALDLQTMGYAGEFPYRSCIPVSPLGRGSTSLCLSVNYENKNYVAKISRNRGPLNVERVILKYLKSKNNNLQVPTAVDVTDNSDLYDAFRSSPAKVILKRTERGDIFTEPSFNEFPYVSFLTEVYDHRYPSQITLKHFQQLWNILKEVHKCGISHRDIRIPNLGFKRNQNNQYDIYLLDWSSCLPFVLIPELSQIDNNNYLRGCISTASINVLERMKENGKINNYICYPSDEAISVIYLAYRHTSTKKFQVPNKPTLAIVTWGVEKMKMSPQVLEAINALEQMGQDEVSNVYEGFGTDAQDNSKIESYLNSIENHVLTALHVLFNK